MKMKYTFATKINGTEESGIIDMDTLIVVCLCLESKSELLLQALNAYNINSKKNKQ